MVRSRWSGWKAVGCQFDHDRPFAAKAGEWSRYVGLRAGGVAATRLMVNLPSLAVSAAAVLAESHGSSGALADGDCGGGRWRRGGARRRFEIAEVMIFSEGEATRRGRKR